MSDKGPYGDLYADYRDAYDPKYGIVDVPMVFANEKTLEGYGNIVYDFDKEEVSIETWPASGHRAVQQGNQGGVSEGDYLHIWKGNQITTTNMAVQYPPFLTGVLPQDVATNNRTHVLVKSANYHPDGGQVFYPVDGKPFVALLALPGDDVKPQDFVAFYFDGSSGLQIKPNVWHESMYPINDEQIFHNKQGAIFGCVLVDTAKEFGKYLRVPLKPEFASKD